MCDIHACVTATDCIECACPTLKTNARAQCEEILADVRDFQQSSESENERNSNIESDVGPQMCGGNELVAVPQRQTFGGGVGMGESHNIADTHVSGESGGGRSGGGMGKKNEIVSLKNEIVNLSPSMKGTETELCISRSFAQVGTSPIDHEHATPLPLFEIPNSPPSHGGGHSSSLRESVQAAHSPARFSLHPLPLTPTR